MQPACVGRGKGEARPSAAQKYFQGGTSASDDGGGEETTCAAYTSRRYELRQRVRRSEVKRDRRAARRCPLRMRPFNIRSKCRGYMDCIRGCVKENNRDHGAWGSKYIRIHEFRKGEFDFASAEDDFFHEVPRRRRTSTSGRSASTARIRPAWTSVPVRPPGWSRTASSWSTTAECIGCPLLHRGVPLTRVASAGATPSRFPADEVSPESAFTWGTGFERAGWWRSAFLHPCRTREGRNRVRRSLPDRRARVFEVSWIQTARSAGGAGERAGLSACKDRPRDQQVLVLHGLMR